MLRMSRLAAVILCLTALIAAPAAAVELTFFVTGDTHYGFVTPETQNLAVVNDMNALPGTAYPGSGGTVATPAFVAVLGDVAQRDDNPAYQAPAVAWQRFLDHFGANGTDGLLHYPVRELLGNHDYGNDFSYGGQIRAAITARHGGLYYSANIGGVHVVSLDIWPDAEVRTWLAGDLAALPANAPVILLQHDPPTPDSSHQSQGFIIDTDSTAFYNTVAPYNVIGLFHGHDHSAASYTWNGLSVYRPGSPTKGTASFLVVHVTDTAVTVDQRYWDSDTWGFHDGRTIMTPEPATLALLALGTLSLVARRRMIR